MLPQFRIEEHRDGDGALRLAVHGELDLTVAGQLQARLRDLQREGASVRLDLSKLDFIDSSGIRVVTLAALDARRDGWDLEVLRELPPTVRRPFELLGMQAALWPEPQ
ncbi:MAG TPA: STAS domain-containing protein [Solirubrobacteraceae bacterium]|jgi:anti-anti-sigma factor